MANPKADVRPQKLARALKKNGHAVHTLHFDMRGKGILARVKHVLRSTVNALQLNGYDVLHMIDPWDIGLVPMLLNNIPKVFDMRSSWGYMIRQNRSGFKSRVLSWIADQFTKLLVRKSNHVTTVDPRLVQIILRMNNNVRWSYLRNMPEDAMFENVVYVDDEDHTRYGYLGVIGAERRVDLLLKAWGEFTNKHNDCHLWIAGWVNQFDSYWKQHVEPYLGEHRLHMLGRIPFRDVPTLYRKMDFIVIPNKGDHWSLKLMEAVAAGVPVIVRRGPLKERILGDKGVVYFDEDEDFPRALEESWKKQEKLKSEARARAKTTQTWEDEVKRLVKVYESII